MPMTLSGRDVADAISSTSRIGGVRREDRAGLRHPVEAGEDVLLDVHVLVDRLDHEVLRAEIGDGRASP
jgi:hypothetical protein